MIQDFKSIEKIADHYGYEKQKNKTIEELIELADAIIHDQEDNIIEEIADVLIMLNQLIYLKQIKEKVDQTVKEKIERQIKRIEKEYDTVIYGKHSPHASKEYIWRIPSWMAVPDIGDVVRAKTIYGPSCVIVTRVEKVPRKIAKQHSMCLGTCEFCKKQEPFLSF